MDENLFNPQRERMLKLALAKMPYGKYSGRYLSDLPEAYLVWLKNNHLPKGALGNMILEMHEIKMNGLEGLLKKIRNNLNTSI